MALLFTGFIYAADTGVVLRGGYEYRSYLHRSTPKLLAKWSFTIWLNGCSWIMDCTNIIPSTNDVVLRITTSCDGTNIYVVHYPNNLAEVYTGSYPSSTDIKLQYLWLAYASQCVLTGATGNAKPPLPIDRGIFKREDYTCQYKWIYSSNSTPLALMLLNDGTLFSRDRTTGEVIHENYHPPYGEGFTRATAVWGSVTNIMNIFIPQEFQLTIYDSKANGLSATDLDRVATFDCRVTNSAIADMPQLAITLPNNAIVTDRRFSTAGYAYISYIITNGIWLSKDKVENLGIFVTSPKLSEEDEALAELGIKQITDPLLPASKVVRMTQVTYLTWIVCCVPPIVLCAFLVRTRVIARKSKNKKQ